MGSKWGKLIVAAAIILIFAAITQWTRRQSRQFEVNPDEFHAVPNMQSIIEQDSASVPGLHLANRFDLTHTLDLKLPVPGLGRKLNFEKIWVSSHSGDFYLLYGFSIRKSDRTPEDLPVLTFSRIKFTTPQGKTVEASVSLKPLPNGNAYKKHFYRGIKVTPHFKDTAPDFSTIQTITLINPEVININGTHAIRLKNITLNVDYIGKQVLMRDPIQKSIQLEKGNVVHLNNLQIRMDTYRLNFNISPRNHLTHIHFGLTVPPYHYSLILEKQGKGFRDFRRLPGPIPKLVYVALAEAEYRVHGKTSSVILQQKPIPVHPHVKSQNP